MYPPLELYELQKMFGILDQALNREDYLEKSPYDSGTREIIQKILTLLQPVRLVEKFKEEDKNPVGRPRSGPVINVTEIEKEIEELRKEISQLKLDAKGMETGDRIQIVKTRAALVEKILGMKERTNNLKLQQKFIDDILAVMEDIMDETQRTKVMSKLRSYAEG